jgi:hypothetical protein
MTRELFCSTPGTLKRRREAGCSFAKLSGTQKAQRYYTEGGLKINSLPNSHVKLTLRSLFYSINVLLVI